MAVVCSKYEWHQAIFLVLKSTLSDINIDLSSFLCFNMVYNLSCSYFQRTLSLFLICFCRQHIVWLYIIHSGYLHLIIAVFIYLTGKWAQIWLGLHLIFCYLSSIDPMLLVLFPSPFRDFKIIVMIPFIFSRWF